MRVEVFPGLLKLNSHILGILQVIIEIVILRKRSFVLSCALKAMIILRSYLLSFEAKLIVGEVIKLRMNFVHLFDRSTSCFHKFLAKIQAKQWILV